MVESMLDGLFSRAVFDRVLSRVPGGQRAEREHAFSLFSSLPLPTPKDEAWTHTNLAAFDFAACKPVEAGGLGTEAGNVVVQARASFSAPTPASFRDKMGALVTAFAADGFRASVKPGARGRLSVRVSPSASTVFANVVDVGEGAVLDYREEASGGAGCFLAGRTVFRLAAGAVVNYASMQQLDVSALSVVGKEFHLARGAEANVLQGEFGGALSRVVLDQHFEGDGARSPVNRAVYFGNGSQHFDLTTNAFHVARNTQCRIRVKGALRGRSRSVYRGLVNIGKRAAGADSFLEDRVLHLSRGVASNSVPSLVIDNNDVKASHAATVSKLDDDALFYLSSRGLPRARAAHLVVQGFLGDAVRDAPAGFFKDGVERLVGEKLDAPP